jgi:hypothetical protein
LLLEAATAAGDPELSVEDDVEFIETNDLSAYPRLMALSDELSQDAFDDEFEDALEDLINRVAIFR